MRNCYYHYDIYIYSALIYDLFLQKKKKKKKKKRTGRDRSIFFLNSMKVHVTTTIKRIEKIEVGE